LDQRTSRASPSVLKLNQLYIAGLTESDESDDEFDDVLYSLIDGEEEI
jgi:hypothetical protein